MARIKDIEQLTFREMMTHLDLYSGLPDGLIELPLPGKIQIGRKKYDIPSTMNEFAGNICYGQRLFLAREEPNDIGLITRMMDGYYYPVVTGKKWDEEKALLFGNKILPCKVKELYPVAMHLIKLVSELADREIKLLHREPSKIELAAGIEKLNVFSEMMSLDFLRDNMKISIPEVILTPYNECLVRFMNAKEMAAFQERYFELIKEEATAKPKYKK